MYLSTYVSCAYICSYLDFLHIHIYMYLSTYVSCTYICSYLDSKPVFLHIRIYICISCTYICNHLSLNLLPFIYIFIYVPHVYIYLQQFWVPSKRFQIDLNDWRLFKNFKIFPLLTSPKGRPGGAFYMLWSCLCVTW